MRRIPVIALGLLATSFTAFAVEDNETIRQSFGAKAVLEVRNVNGRIRVTASNTSNIQLVATKHIDADNQAALAQARSEVRLDIQETGGRLLICVIHIWEDCRGNQGGNNRDHRRRDYEAKMDLELQVPARTEIDLRAVNGPVDVTGIQGRFHVEAVNGRLTMTGMENSGWVHAVNGAISLSFAKAPSGPLDVKTVNGEIEAAFPASLNAKLSFKTFHGEVFTDFATSNSTSSSSRNRRELSVNVGSGRGLEHHFETLNGETRIARR